jgi:hypothetical protein
MRLRPLVLGFAVLLADCATLDPIAAGTCGNGVVDAASEDCDTFPAGRCGAPGTVTQCRLECGKKDEGGKDIDSCPPGWGCSVDKICREPSQPSLFDDATERVSICVTSLLVGDFDDDGRKDIFGTSALATTGGKGRIHYFGKGGALVQTVPLPALIRSPFVRDFDGDHKDDLAFAYEFSSFGTISGGFAVALGQPDRAIVPKLFPSFTLAQFDGVILPLVGTVPPNQQSLIAVAHGTQNDEPAQDVVLSVDSDLQGKPGFLQVLPGDVRKTAALVVSGLLLDADTTSACGEVVVPIEAPSGWHVLVYSPCRRSPTDDRVATWARDRAPVDLPLPAGETVTGVFVADVDRNGHLDILIALGSGSVYVAEGIDGKQLAAPRLQATFTELPLASADLNADGITDYVVPSGLMISVSQPSGGASAEAGIDASASDAGPADGGGKFLGFYPVAAPTKHWTVAAIGDVNRDGIPDVIGASSIEPDLDVLAGTHDNGGLFMPSFTVTTNGTVTHLLVSDLDLDGTQDVAFTETRPSSNDSDVAVAYGRAMTMPPEAERLVGRASGVKQFTRFAPESGQVVIATSSVSNDAAKLPTYSLAILFPTGERQPFAPLLLDDSQSSRDRPKAPANSRREWLPLVVAAGPIEVKDRVDLVTLAQGTVRAGIGAAARPSAFGIWTARSIGSVAFDQPTERLPLADLERAVQSAPVNTSLVLQARMGDLDGDGIDELVALAPAGGPPQNPQSTIRIFKTMTMSGAMSTTTLTTKLISVPDLGVVPGGRAELVDVDSDGHLDLVAVLVDPAPASAAAVHIFYGDGSGGFIVPGERVDLHQSNADESYAVGFALVVTGGAAIGGSATDVRREVAIATTKRLFRARRPPGRGPFDVLDETARFGAAGLINASDVAAGDFDGDGVEDLAVADSGSIRILRQRPRLP